MVYINVWFARAVASARGVVRSYYTYITHRLRARTSASPTPIAAPSAMSRRRCMTSRGGGVGRGAGSVGAGGGAGGRFVGSLSMEPEDL